MGIIICPTFMSVLWNAAYDGEEQTVRRLAAGNDLDWTNSWGQTSLFIACQNGHDGTVQILLDAGANTTIASKGKTPHDIAREKGHARIMEMLEAAIKPATLGLVELLAAHHLSDK